MTSSKPILKYLFATVCTIALLALADMMFVRCCGLQPQDSTRTTMSGIKRRILRFAHENNRLPNSFEDLPLLPNSSNKTTDWWGNPIQYEVSAEGIISLKSLGGNVWGRDPREGLPITRSFPTKKSTGEWTDETVEFIEDRMQRGEEKGSGLLNREGEKVRKKRKNVTLYANNSK